MAQITITFDDAKKDRIINGLCGQYSYQATIRNEDGTEAPNPETKAQFAKRQVIRFVKESVSAYEAGQAAETARVSAVNSAETDITLS